MTAVITSAIAMTTDPCPALVNDDRRSLQQVIDGYLKTLPSRDPVNARVEKVRQWISRQPCVASAELSPDLLDTQPPVQQILVVLADDVKPPRQRTIGIVLDPAGPRFNYR